jgi:ribosomal protein S18 acetylase RimI-like enzyme
VSAGAPAVELRAATAADDPFLLRVYASVREPELEAAGFPVEQRGAFVTQQFEAQSRHYAEHYTETSFDLILVDGEPAGRLIVARWERELRIVDIALLPDWRGQGVGGALLRTLIAEAEERGVKASIHVEQFNPALALYQRLGFAPVGEHGVYLLLERPPGAAAAQAKTAS